MTSEWKEEPMTKDTATIAPRTNIKASFGEKLKFYRKERRLSQAELAQTLGITVKHLSAIERGVNFVSAPLLEKLGAFFEIPVFLFFITGEEPPPPDIHPETLDRIITAHLLQTIEEIRTDIRRERPPAQVR
jgi:transcriptional regulator with XRE-family HTH domain